ncbi:MAG: 4-(cytidine 5'-diphospho)-2-C-methyl-D-erythritol kinase [Chitinophagaceae bacterium]|nr:4-(cytidine 5'-diphospho)-2-C-methyl-D-erythritol kinase [Chitinophagaceae bacterium]
MIRFPNAKINLGLNILEKRPDAYHNLETIFYPLNLHDALEFQAASELRLEVSGTLVPGLPEDNLVMKAYRLLQQDFSQIPALQIHLLKHIPTGAGLGGGSSDASHLLMMLNDAFGLGLTQDKLIDYALQLGSDCPFFILNQPCFAEGRGEILHPLKLDLSTYFFVLIKPEFAVSTAWAFSQIIPAKPSTSLSELIQAPVEDWKVCVKNDFEAPVFNAYPALSHIKQSLYDAGAVYSAMSGSGSTLYGLFKEKDREEVQIKLNLMQWPGSSKIYFA